MLNNIYDVIIIGGGPVGTALAIELGLNNVKTLVLEKYEQPIATPRAQSLSARSMEFFLRWNIDQKLENSCLFPKDYPQVGVWCSSLNGDVYGVATWGDNCLPENSSPKTGMRIPLWITEEILRDRLSELSDITFLKNHEVTNITVDNEVVTVESYDRINHTAKSHYSSFLANCDGANGISKQILKNNYSTLSEKSQMLCIHFIAHDLANKITVPHGIYYSIMSNNHSFILLPIDLKQGIWAIQMVWTEHSQDIQVKRLHQLLEELIDEPFSKEILTHYFWDLQVQLADYFNLDNRIFWLGDAAHSFSPIGALGLNTGFGDAVNLAWKLSAVIKHQAPVTLLQTYADERRQICINNLDFSLQSTHEYLTLKNKYPPNDNYATFALASAELGKKFLSSAGLTLGYCYKDSALNRNLQPVEHSVSLPDKYQPRVEPGYFLPHRIYQHETIYSKLSAISWNLLLYKNKIETLDYQTLKGHLQLENLHILEIDSEIYPYSYVLIRPDWHIARVGNDLASILGSVFESL